MTDTRIVTDEEPGLRTTGSSFALPAVLTGVLVAGAVTVTVRDPNVPGHLGACPLLALFGIACPGCGGLRGLRDLVHGDLAGAWALNPLLVAAVPFVMAAIVRWFADARAGRPPWSPPTWAAAAAAAVIVAFGVLRNIPLLTPYLGPAAFG